MGTGVETRCPRGCEPRPHHTLWGRMPPCRNPFSVQKRRLARFKARASKDSNCLAVLIASTWVENSFVGVLVAKSSGKNRILPPKEARLSVKHDCFVGIFLRSSLLFSEKSVSQPRTSLQKRLGRDFSPSGWLLRAETF